MEEGIVRPIKGKSSPDLGPLVVLAATGTDLSDLCRLLGRDPSQKLRLFTSKLFVNGQEPALVGPLVGAPHAAMLLETLIVWGATKFLFYGWCGSISSEIRVGDILVPTAAIVDEGTSPHYMEESGSMERLVQPSLSMKSLVVKGLSGTQAREVVVWSTDAIFRETASQVHRFRSRGAAAVDMETSALFSVGRFLNVDVAAVLVVSDDLSELSWRPGFRDPRFLEARHAVCQGIAALCRMPFK